MPHKKESIIGHWGSLDVLKKEFRRLDDPEAERQEKAVHRIRVISRHLQVQTQLLAEMAGRKRKSRDLRKDLKALRRLLGKVREADVHRKLWGEIAAGHPYFLNVDRTIENRREKAFQRFQNKWNRKRLNKIVSKARRALEGFGERSGTVSPRRAISSRMTAIARMPMAPAEDDLESIHSLRLQVKKLRYLLEALETMNALHHFRSARPLSLLKELQGELGSIHDCETIIEFLEKTIRKSRDVWDPRTQAGVEKACEELKQKLHTAAAQWHRRWPERRKALASFTSHSESCVVGSGLAAIRPHHQKRKVNR